MITVLSQLVLRWFLLYSRQRHHVKVRRRRYCCTRGNSGFQTASKNHDSRVSAFFVTDNTASSTLPQNLQLFSGGDFAGEIRQPFESFMLNGCRFGRLADSDRFY